MAAPFDLPKSGGAYASPAPPPPFDTCLYILAEKQYYAKCADDRNLRDSYLHFNHGLIQSKLPRCLKSPMNASFQKFQGV